MISSFNVKKPLHSIGIHFLSVSNFAADLQRDRKFVLAHLQHTIPYHTILYPYPYPYHTPTVSDDVSVTRRRSYEAGPKMGLLQSTL